MVGKECPKCGQNVASELSVCRSCGYRFDGTGKFDLVNFIAFSVVAMIVIGIAAIWVWDFAERSERDRNIEASVAEYAAQRQATANQRTNNLSSNALLPDHEIERGTLLEGQRISIQVDREISKSECRALIRHYESQAQGGQVVVDKPNPSLEGELWPWCVQNFDGRGIRFNDEQFAALPPAPAEPPEYTRQDELRRWVMENALPGAAWDLNRYSRHLGSVEQGSSTLQNHRAYYFSRPDMTIIVNSVRGEVTIWRMGRASS